MAQLRMTIETPKGLTISSDACKGLATAIASEFPDFEHRECMKHLMENFKKGVMVMSSLITYGPPQRRTP
jgi:hypothetical protein